METDDILTDQVQISRPVLVEQLAAVAVTVITDTGDVVAQCVQPYIGYVLWIKGYRNTPCKRGSGYTQILQTRKKEVVHHLVLTGYRLNKLRMGVDMLDQTVCVFAHLKEISFFLCRLYFTSTVRTFAVYELGFSKERFTRSTVHTFIVSLVNVSFIVHIFENLLNLCFVIFVCGTDKFVIGSIH